MTPRDGGDPSLGRWRNVVLALVFALLSHGFYQFVVEFTWSPF